MSRSLRTALAWRKPYWLRRAPGRIKGTLLLLLPATFFLPWTALPFISDTVGGVAFVLWLSGVILALQVAGGDPVRTDFWVWTFQKGLAPSESAFSNAVLDLCLAGAYASLWALCGALFYGLDEPWTLGLAFLARGWTAFAVTYASVFALAALGVERPNDLTVGLIVVSLLTPALTLISEISAVLWLRWLIPPFRGPIELSGAIMTGSTVGITGASLHILLFCSLAMSVGLASMARWRPEV